MRSVEGEPTVRGVDFEQLDAVVVQQVLQVVFHEAPKVEVADYKRQFVDDVELIFSDQPLEVGLQVAPTLLVDLGLTYLQLYLKHQLRVQVVSIRVPANPHVVELFLELQAPR